MRTERLGDLGDAPAVLAAVADAGGKLGLGSPAALIGDWFGSRAVIARVQADGESRPHQGMVDLYPQ